MVNSKVSSNSDTQSVNKSIFEIPKMDCPAEEQSIRLALDGVEGIRNLNFDLTGRRLTVWHIGDVDVIAACIDRLRLGSSLLQTTHQPTLTLPEGVRTSSDKDQAQVLRQLLAINGTMFIVEFLAGWLAQSIGLIADSLDMFADAGVYGISLYAVGRVARLKLKAAHLSGWFQVFLAIGTLLEVIRRFVFGSEPEPAYMLGVASLALIANVTCLVLLARHREGGAHMKASWIFSTNDVIANLGVISAGVLVGLTGSRFPDLLVGSVIGVIVLSGGIRILKLR